ncbi:hypothetical protein EG329_011333 [Mollisiaceae sp. DMI_Dod_QoI]|nr:hypothetical protein EG329_011333 [Helotiales sp. DMI_Dod_QoI]
MATNYPAPGPCAFSGFQCEGVPRGKDGTDTNGHPWYTVEPWGNHNSRRGIIYFSDEKGIWHNSRVLADQFAGAGYYTVIINHTGVVREEGKPYEKTDPKLKASGANLTRMVDNAYFWLGSQGCTKIGAVGYCAGGVPVLRLLNSKSVDAGFIAHPTNTSEALFKEIKAPLSVAFADNDNRIGVSARTAAATGLLASNQPYQISLYSHIHHGFACRRAFTTEAEVFAKKQAFIQAITWMEEHLRDDSIDGI